MHPFPIEPETADRLAALGLCNQSAEDYRSAAGFCRQQAERYSAELVRCHAERKLLGLRRSTDRRSAARRQELTDSMARCGEMTARWNELARLYEQKAGLLP